jgi:hypothetical protein
MPRVCPPWVQNLAKKPNSTNSSTVDSNGSPSSAPDSVRAHFGFADDRDLDHLVDEAVTISRAVHSRKS